MSGGASASERAAGGGGHSNNGRQTQSLSPAKAFHQAVALPMMDRTKSQESERELGEISPDMPRGRRLGSHDNEGVNDDHRGRSPVVVIGSVIKRNSTSRDRSSGTDALKGHRDRSRSSSGPTGPNAIAPLHVRELRAAGSVSVKQERPSSPSPPMLTQKREQSLDQKGTAPGREEEESRASAAARIGPRLTTFDEPSGEDGKEDEQSRNEANGASPRSVKDLTSERKSSSPVLKGALQVDLEQSTERTLPAQEQETKSSQNETVLPAREASSPPTKTNASDTLREHHASSPADAPPQPVVISKPPSPPKSQGQVGERDVRAAHITGDAPQETAHEAGSDDVHHPPREALHDDTAKAAKKRIGRSVPEASKELKPVPAISVDLAVKLAQHAMQSRRTHPIVHAIMKQRDQQQDKVPKMISRVLERNTALTCEPDGRAPVGYKFLWDEYASAVISQGTRTVQPLLVQHIVGVKQAEAIRAKRLRSQWDRLDKRWQEQRARVEAENEDIEKLIEEMNKANKPAPVVVDKPGARKTRRGGYDPAQDALGIHDNDPAALARVLQQLRQADEADPNQRALKTEAVIPDMDPPHERWRAEDNNSLVADPLTFYADSSFDDKPWSEQEEMEFRRLFLKYPKQFGVIAAGLQGRSPGECVRHYYLVKKIWGFKEGALRRAPVTPLVELESFKGLSRPVTPRVDSSTSSRNPKKRIAAEVETSTSKVKRKPAAKRRVDATRAEKEAAETTAANTTAVKRKRVKASKQVQVVAPGLESTEVARRPVGPQLGVFLPDATRSPTIVPTAASLTTASRGMNIQSLLNGSPATTLSSLPPAHQPFDTRSAASDATEEDAIMGGTT